METYLVGGAVRDALLDRAVSERDWVVVGATAAEMEAAGFRRVGKDFPVFLHPETGEEYALARTERKTAAGYHGFAVYAGADVSLEDDLRRRDLTVNAIAQTASGELVDPWGGQADIAARRLRHVSAAFREDPLRVLRTARFAASLASYGFTIASETRELMATMAQDGELGALVPERVWKELAKALRTDRPDVFVAALRECGALAQVLPEVDGLFGVPQPAEWHPEVDTGEHVLLTLRAAAQLTASLPVRFAALVHDLGKGTTPAAEWPAHHGHEQRGLALITALCKRLAVPNDCRDMALHVAQYHTHVHRAGELRPATLLKVLEAVDAFRRPERFAEFLLGCEADARGRAGLNDRAYPQAAQFSAAFAAAREVTTEPLVAAGLQGPAFGDALRKARVSAIKKAVAG